MQLPHIGTDPEDVIRNAFACFDEEATGKISEDRLRELLTTMGDRFTDAEVRWLCGASFSSSASFLNIICYTTHGGRLVFGVLVYVNRL